MRDSSLSSSVWLDDRDELPQQRKSSAKNTSSKPSVESEQSRKLAKRGLRIGRSPVGKAVFATRRIFDGTCIGEIEGEVISDDEYRSRYAFDLENGAQLEPAPPFRFVNHSCEPNSGFRDGLDLVALRDILPGEEITWDYSTAIDESDFAGFPCGCGASVCRGIVASFRHLPAVVQQRIRPWLLPYLQDKYFSKRG